MTRQAVTILTVVLALAMIGILMVYSATAVNTSGQGNPFGDLSHQLVCVSLGLFGMMVALRIDYHFYAKPWVYLGLVAIAVTLLVLVLIPGVGFEKYGAVRWIRLPSGFTFQPSEVAKVVLIILLAARLSSDQIDIKSFRYGFVPALTVTSAFAGLVLAENDLGVPVVMMAVAFFMIFMAGTRWIYVIASMTLAGGSVAAIAVTTPHRMKRIVAFMDPWQYAADEGFQLVQSLSAFAKGSVTGRGLGGSEQKLFYLPFAESDFIFAVLGEEMGLVGTVLIVTLFAVFLTVSLRVALCARDLFGTLLAGGIAVLVGVQAALNMGVTTGLLPTKGLPLPFISSGGTALIINLSMIGILLNIALQAREDEAEKRVAARA